MIIIRGLNKAFGEKIIFSNFNLEIPDGSFVVISGDSGSGKSEYGYSAGYEYCRYL